MLRTKLSYEELLAIVERDQVDSTVMDAYLTRVPDAWRLAERVPKGGTVFARGSLVVIVSVMHYPDDAGQREVWIHASASRNHELPSWDDMKRIKRDFFGPDVWAYQVFPPEAEYVNDHAFVLHLFGRLDGKPGLPDFTRGLGTL